MYDRPDLTVVGHKDDDNKPQPMKGFIRQFPLAILELARVSEFGAEKYAWGNWKKFENWDRLDEAMVRHIIDEALGEEVEEESALMVAAHTAWNAMARLELMLRDECEEHFKSDAQTAEDSCD